MERDRLFVPLKTEPYQWFKNGPKEWEVRAVDDRFNSNTVYAGREVEFRCGYTKKRPALWGRISDVRTYSAPSEIASDIDPEKIHPGVGPVELADSIVEFLGRKDEYIVFRVPEVWIHPGRD